MTRKTYTTQAAAFTGEVLADVTVNTRSAERLAQSELIQMCARQPGGGYLRRRTEGAKGWGMYRVPAGARHADLMPVADQDAARRIFAALEAAALVGR